MASIVPRMAKRAMSSSSSKVSIEKITARVFCLGRSKQWDGSYTRNSEQQSHSMGGNPVTIFASPKRLCPAIQTKLAKSCDWESVVVETSTKTMSFFMPSGEEVSFCAHAAIGGAIAVEGDNDSKNSESSSSSSSSSSHRFQTAITSDSFRVDTSSSRSSNDTNIYNSSVCCLHMTRVPFTDEPLSVTAANTLQEWSDRLGWKHSATAMPTNASVVARPKTLVELESVDALHRAVPPPMESFAAACTAMDDSTGVYVYARLPPIDDEPQNRVSLECRQFPRSSGYEEDPATGIAAAALAASLEFGTNHRATKQTKTTTAAEYDVYQGTAMGRPSLIQVLNLRREEESTNGDGLTVSFGLQGTVEVDGRCTIEVSD